MLTQVSFILSQSMHLTDRETDRKALVHYNVGTTMMKHTA